MCCTTGGAVVKINGPFSACTLSHLHTWSTFSERHKCGIMANDGLAKRGKNGPKTFTTPGPLETSGLCRLTSAAKPGHAAQMGRPDNPPQIVRIYSGLGQGVKPHAEQANVHRPRQRANAWPTACHFQKPKLPCICMASRRCMMNIPM